MDKQEMIATINRERENLEHVIGALTPGQVTEPDQIGTWSVKDVVAHLAIWTSRCVTVLFNAEQGQDPEDIDAMFDRYDALNAEDYQAQKERPFDRVLADYRGAQRQLLRRLDAWKEDVLFDKARFHWLRGKCMGEFVMLLVTDHEAEHCKEIRQLGL